MNLSKLLDEIQADLLSGDFDAETKYATHFLHIKSLKEIPSQELKEDIEVLKGHTDIYKNLVELSSSSEIAEMVEALAYRLAFYMTLSQSISMRYTASRIIINKLVSGELKLCQPQEIGNKLEEVQKQHKRFGKSLGNN